MSLFMGFVPVVLATLIGGTLGVIAGYCGGAVNMAHHAHHGRVLRLSVGAAGGRDLGRARRGIVNSLVSLTLVFIPPIGRVAETVTTQVRAQDFVEAARASGAAGWRIIFGHVLSNVIGPILIYASSLISVVHPDRLGPVFLGLGVAPPEADGA